ncbi:MAG: M48 family metallopeptidase [Gammaproteobacteria bacterium]|nr:M48 family metallopeptidase [Gammaproteobacteria bacterium]
MMSIRLKKLLSITVVALLASTSAMSAATRSGPNWISDDEIAAEAARQFAEMKASMPLLTDQPTIEYIACVANAVVQVLEPEYRDLPWEMAIFDDESVNAFAMPGGKIGVMRGILNAAQNQHQLAAVIGHEIAHVTAKHSNERANRTKISGVGIQVAAVLLGGGNQGATYTAYEALNQGVPLLVLLPFSRKQESEADVIGLEYMSRAGFDPRQAVPLWQNMMKKGDKAPSEFLSTHPSGEKRIDSLISQWGDTLPLYNEALQSGHDPNCQQP